MDTGRTLDDVPCVTLRSGSAENARERWRAIGAIIAVRALNIRALNPTPAFGTEEPVLILFAASATCLADVTEWRGRIPCTGRERHRHRGSLVLSAYGRLSIASW